MAEVMAAARLGDPVGHSLGVAGMIAGAVAGLAIGAALLGATVLTGGVAGVAAAAVIAGMVGGGALAGGQLVKGLMTVLGLSHPTTGTLARGSPNVRVNGKPAVRAKLDFVDTCTGLYGLQHLPKPSARVAEGSATVRVNGQPAARVKDRLECAAEITQGSPNVVIGGPTEAALPVAATNEDVATQVAQVLVVVGLAGAAGLAVVGAATVGGALLGLGKLGAGVYAFGQVNEGLGWVGDRLGPGYRDLLQGTFGMGTMLAGPRMARSAQRRATAARVRNNVAASQRARAASGFGGRTPKPGSRAGLTPKQQARAQRKLGESRTRAERVAAGQARGRTPAPRRETWVRRDNYPYSAQGKTPDRLKSHVGADGSLRPANPNGRATVQDHVRGSEPRKSDSPFTSLSEEGATGAKDYGGHRVEVDAGRLRQDVASGKVRDVELLNHREVLARHDEYIRAAQERYNANPTPRNQKSLERALQDRANSVRDQEVLIRGVVPPEYVTVTPPSPPPP